MLNRFRLFLLSVVTLVATATFSLSAATPADATPASGCLHPSLSGSVDTVIDPWTGERFLRYRATGYAPDLCQDSTSVDYTYTATFRQMTSGGEYNRTTLSATSLEQIHRSPGGTRIVFPEGSAAKSQILAPRGVYLTIEATKSLRFTGQSSTDVQVYFLDSTGDYNTAELIESPPCYSYAYKPSCP